MKAEVLNRHLPIPVQRDIPAHSPVQELCPRLYLKYKCIATAAHLPLNHLKGHLPSYALLHLQHSSCISRPLSCWIPWYRPWFCDAQPICCRCATDFINCRVYVFIRGRRGETVQDLSENSALQTPHSKRVIGMGRLSSTLGTWDIFSSQTSLVFKGQMQFLLQHRLRKEHSAAQSLLEMPSKHMALSVPLSLLNLNQAEPSGAVPVQRHWHILWHPCTTLMLQSLTLHNQAHTENSDSSEFAL